MQNLCCYHWRIYCLKLTPALRCIDILLGLHNLSFFFFFLLRKSWLSGFSWITEIHDNTKLEGSSTCPLSSIPFLHIWHHSHVGLINTVKQLWILVNWNNGLEMLSPLSVESKSQMWHFYSLPSFVYRTINSLSTDIMWIIHIV